MMKEVNSEQVMSG